MITVVVVLFPRRVPRGWLDRVLIGIVAVSTGVSMVAAALRPGLIVTTPDNPDGAPVHTLNPAGVPGLRGIVDSVGGAYLALTLVLNLVILGLIATRWWRASGVERRQYRWVFLLSIGLSLNIMTLSALALGIGTVVDGATVVLENILHKKRHARKEGKSEDGVVLSVEGTEELFTSLIGSTLTTVVVFLPIVFINKQVKILYSGLAYTIAFSMVASLLVAVTLAPLLASRLALPAHTGYLSQTERAKLALIINWLRRQTPAFVFRATAWAAEATRRAWGAGCGGVARWGRTAAPGTSWHGEFRRQRPLHPRRDVRVGRRRRRAFSRARHVGAHPHSGSRGHRHRRRNRRAPPA